MGYKIYVVATIATVATHCTEPLTKRVLHAGRKESEKIPHNLRQNMETANIGVHAPDPKSSFSF